VPVVRADWTVIDDAWKADSGEFHRVVVTPAEAAAMGAGAICMYLIGGPATGEMFAGNVAAVAKAAHEADRVGLPLIVEATLPRPERTGIRGHLTPQEAGEHAQKANVKRVLLTHVSDELDELWVSKCAKRAFGGQIAIAREGAVYEA